ncbi:MAG: protoheme IX farnesyltransferase [Gammaproteobacteria bacterium]|jgi:protoheme IX farnesyltransferase|nr:protoheme IX farnesyltransferase [Gammaproteobacteria bacterium]
MTFIMQKLIQPYLKISKFKVILLMLITAWMGVLLAPKPAGWSEMQTITALIGIMLIAASGSAMNHLAEIEVDQKMARTQKRPLATGELSSKQVIIFATLCLLIGSIVLHFFNNTQTTLLSILTMLGYGVVYTRWLKPATSQNIVIGGLSGALPPLLGWTSVTGQISAEPLILVLIIFTWTPPHFWALAINRINDYEKIHYPMLPVTHGISYTATHITLYSILLIISTQLPFVIGMSGAIYLITANILNIFFFTDVVLLQLDPCAKNGKRVFYHSILYLFLLFIMMILDYHLPMKLVIY